MLMLSQQTGSYCGLLESVDFHALGSRGCAGDEGDVAARKIEGVRQEGDERVVRGAVNGRRRKPDQDGAGPLTINARARRSGYDADIDRDCQLPTADC